MKIKIKKKKSEDDIHVSQKESKVLLDCSKKQEYFLTNIYKYNSMNYN